jgi:hypothetical protein
MIGSVNPARALEEHRGVCCISDADERTGQPIPRMKPVYAVAVSEAETQRLKAGYPRGENGSERRPPMLKSAA